MDISSTEIRRRVRQNLPIDHLVPPPVARYINEHGLYRA
jgi:nicotinate-nucleotide adenylyltransferase